MNISNKQAEAARAALEIALARYESDACLLRGAIVRHLPEQSTLDPMVEAIERAEAELKAKIRVGEDLIKEIEDELT